MTPPRSSQDFLQEIVNYAKVFKTVLTDLPVIKTRDRSSPRRPNQTPLIAGVLTEISKARGRVLKTCRNVD